MWKVVNAVKAGKNLGSIDDVFTNNFAKCIYGLRSVEMCAKHTKVSYTIRNTITLHKIILILVWITRLSKRNFDRQSHINA